MSVLLVAVVDGVEIENAVLALHRRPAPNVLSDRVRSIYGKRVMGARPASPGVAFPPRPALTRLPAIARAFLENVPG
jgi:hypothetical protein